MTRQWWMGDLLVIPGRPTGGGGGKRDRTADLLHAMQALSQLSYTPYTAPYTAPYTEISDFHLKFFFSW